VPKDGTYHDVYNERASGGLLGDVVPFLDPRNWGNHLSGSITSKPGRSGHSWDLNYGTAALERSEKAEPGPTVEEIFNELSR